MTLYHQHPQPPFSRTARDTKAVSRSVSPQTTHTFTSTHVTISRDTDSANSEIKEGGVYRGSLGAPDGDRRKCQGDQILLFPGDQEFHLPRSSPVISRRRKPLDRQGGETAASSSVLRSRSPSLVGQAVPVTDQSPPKPASSPSSSSIEKDKKPYWVSVSPNLNRLLNSGLHLPFMKQQGLANKQPERDSRPRSCSDNELRLETQDPVHTSNRSSDIPQCSVDIFRSSCELEKENAHFIVVDLVLEVLETAKWTLSLDRRSSPDTRAHQHSNVRAWTRNCTRRNRSCGEQNKNKLPAEQELEGVQEDVDRTSNAHVRTHEGDEGRPVSGQEHGKSQAKTLSLLSTDSGFEDCGVDKILTKSSLRRSLQCPMMHGSVERLAQQLVLGFRRSWLPSQRPQRGRHSLRTSLQELPGTAGAEGSAGRRSLMEEIRLRTRMRGSRSWAPPRFQIIFTVQPTHRCSEVVASQHFLCAGCGTEVEPRYIKKLRYCEYLGRYFCDCCHGGCEAVIPGRVLAHWDFSRYPVSDFSKQLLDSVWSQPLYDLTSVGKKLYGRVRELEKFRELQEQLLCTSKLLAACRLSEEVTREFGQLPGHLIQQPYLFSMEDLLRCKKGQMVPLAKAVLISAVAHIENCVLCLARGFICELCKENDILFAFQLEKCKQCPECKACFHKECLMGKKCPKCARIQTRRKLLK